MISHCIPLHRNKVASDRPSVYWYWMETSEATQGGKVSTAFCPALVKHSEFLWISEVSVTENRKWHFELGIHGGNHKTSGLLWQQFDMGGQRDTDRSCSAKSGCRGEQYFMMSGNILILSLLKLGLVADITLICGFYYLKLWKEASVNEHDLNPQQYPSDKITFSFLISPDEELSCSVEPATQSHICITHCLVFPS